MSILYDSVGTSSNSSNSAFSPILENNTQSDANRKSKRCNFLECSKKLLLSDQYCKCGMRFCSNHRHFEAHKCTFDFRAKSDEILKKQLVKCVGDRLEEKI